MIVHMDMHGNGTEQIPCTVCIVPRGMGEPLFLATSAAGHHPVKVRARAPLRLSVCACLPACSVADRGGGGVQVSPTVVLSILDHYVRRNDNQDRVIGALLGGVNEAGEIEVRSAFPVPHTEAEDSVRVFSCVPARQGRQTEQERALGGQVLVNLEFQKSMYALHRKVNSKDALIGWYAAPAPARNESAPITVHASVRIPCARADVGCGDGTQVCVGK
jgi:hypothetical protein